MTCCWRLAAHFKYIGEMLGALNVASVVPSEPELALHLRNHGRNPVGLHQGRQTVVLSGFDSRLSCVISFECITASAHAAFNFAELGACNTFPGREAVAQARHFLRPSHGACYFFSFTYFHINLIFVSSMSDPSLSLRL